MDLLEILQWIGIIFAFIVFVAYMLALVLSGSDSDRWERMP